MSEPQTATKKMRNDIRVVSNLSSLWGCKDINAIQIYMGETTTSKSGAYFFLVMGKIPRNNKARTKLKLKLLNPFLK